MFLGGSLGVSWGVSWGSLGGLLGVSWVSYFVYDPQINPPTPSWGQQAVGVSPLGGLLGVFGGLVGLLGVSWGSLGVLLDVIWGALGCFGGSGGCILDRLDPFGVVFFWGGSKY